MANESLIISSTDLSNLNYYNRILNLQAFKVSIEKKLKENDTTYNPESIFSSINVSEIYRYIAIENKFITHDSFKKELFDNITYSVSSNFYFDKLKKTITDSDIINAIKLINDKFNKNYVTADEAPYLKESGYNLMDIIQIRLLNRVVVPVCKYDDKIFELLFVYKYKKTDGSDSYRTCSVKINRETSFVYFFCNSSGGRLKTEEDSVAQSKIISADTFYYFTKQLFSDTFNFVLEPHNTKIEKKLMFQFCNSLNKEMLKEFEDELTKKIKVICDKQIQEISTALGSQITFDKVTQEKIYKKIFSTYLGECMVRLCDEEDLVLIAQDRNLPGFPTLINFISSAASQGKTKTKNKNAPLTFEEVYYSLNTDFSENQELEEWRISWFEIYFFDNAKQTDVSQTTIKITNNYFKVTNLNKTRRTKRMVLFIIGKLRENLSK